jgi:hypothetical protein
VSRDFEKHFVFAITTVGARHNPQSTTLNT